MDKTAQDAKSISPAIPDPCQLPATSNAETSNEERRDSEATELSHVRLFRRQRSSQVTIPRDQWYGPFQRFWSHHIRVSVPHDACRDHLGAPQDRIVHCLAILTLSANERTYLGYLRSSLALSVLGVLIAQLYRLQHAPSPDPVFGYYVLGKPIAAILQASALIIVLVGAHRFWRQQSSMARGTVIVGGWELYLTGSYTVLVRKGPKRCLTKGLADCGYSCSSVFSSSTLSWMSTNLRSDRSDVITMHNVRLALLYITDLLDLQLSRIRVCLASLLRLSGELVKAT